MNSFLDKQAVLDAIYDRSHQYERFVRKCRTAQELGAFETAEWYANDAQQMLNEQADIMRWL